MTTPKKPTQIPPGDLSDAVGKHDETFTDDDNLVSHVDESDDENEVEGGDDE